MSQPIYAIGATTSSVALRWGGNGELTSLIAQVEVNYGTFGRSVQVSLLEKLNPTEKELLQQLTNKLKAAVQAEILGV